MTVFRSAVVRFQGLVFASIAKTSDAMVGHKASRSKGAHQFGQGLLLRIRDFIHEAHVPSAIDRTFPLRQDAHSRRAAATFGLNRNGQPASGVASMMRRPAPKPGSIASYNAPGRMTH
jgi:hypothetical protein